MTLGSCPTPPNVTMETTSATHKVTGNANNFRITTPRSFIVLIEYLFACWSVLWSGKSTFMRCLHRVIYSLHIMPGSALLGWAYDKVPVTFFASPFSWPAQIKQSSRLLLLSVIDNIEALLRELRRSKIDGALGVRINIMECLEYFGRFCFQQFFWELISSKRCYVMSVPAQRKSRCDCICSPRLKDVLAF